MDNVTTAIISIVTALGTGFVGWIFGRKKQNAETVGVEIQNVGQALLIFQKDVVEPLRVELKKTREELEEAREEIATLRNQIEQVHQENQELKNKH